MNVYDIAARLKVSHTTVSLALRNHPRISEKTRLLVQQTAKEMGYSPNPLVRALMSQVRQSKVGPTGEVLAFLTAHTEEGAWKHLPSLVEQFEGAKERAVELGFSVEPLWLGSHGERARMLSRVLFARGMRGSLLPPLADSDRALDFDWSRHAVVAIGRTCPDVPLNRVRHDGVALTSACFKNLVEHGYRRIGIALPAVHTRWSHLWITGFLGSEWIYQSKPIKPIVFDWREGPLAFQRWFKRWRPDAVIGTWPDRPLEWMREMGVKIPEDVGYASLDASGEVAGMVQANRQLGAAAMDVLASQIFRNEIGLPRMPMVSMVEGAWKEGPTVRRLASNHAEADEGGFGVRRATGKAEPSAKRSGPRG